MYLNAATVQDCLGAPSERMRLWQLWHNSALCLVCYASAVVYGTVNGAHMIVFGLSGGAGSGKSTVAAMFAQSCNAAVFDADKIVHSMYSGDAIITGLVAKYFPDCICNGVVSREKAVQAFFFLRCGWNFSPFCTPLC